jgi:uncharacterized protein YjbI with pentapeptide repeats
VRKSSVAPFVSVVAALAIPLACIALFPRLLYPDVPLDAITSPEKRIELLQAQRALENNARSMLLQGFAGILLVVGAMSTWRQVRVARDGNITDRFTKAIEQLGSTKVELRLGGIYALERIAKTSSMDRLAIVEVLTTFIRTNSSAKSSPAPEWMQIRAPDIQAAMNTLGHIPEADEGISLHLPQVDLRRVYLSRARLVRPRMPESNLTGAWMRNAQLIQARLRKTNCTDANMEYTYLVEADLREADLTHANLNGANLHGAVLEGAILSGASLREANLTHARLRGADLRGADLTAAKLAGVDIADVVFDGSTVWPQNFTPRR